MLLVACVLWLGVDVRSAESQPSSVQGFVDEETPSSQPASQPAAEPDEEETQAAVPARANERPWYQQLGLGGFVDAGFAAIWPEQQNTFFVGEVELDVKKTLFDVAGLRIDVNLLNRLPWQPLGVPQNPQFTTFQLAFDNLVEQAYAEWFPLGESGPRLRLGKYNALVGYERQDAPDRFMVSQSLVFMNGSPANFTGVMLHVPLPYSLSVTLHGAINGWDRGLATSRNKTIGAQLMFDHRIKNGTRFLLSFVTLFGTERFANERDYRLAIFGTASVEIPNLFVFATELTWGQEPGVIAGTVGDTVIGTGTPIVSHWFGSSTWVRLVVPKVSWLALTGRYDIFHDPERTRGLVQTLADAQAGGLTDRQQLSFDVAGTITEGALVRVEYTADFLQSRSPDFVRALAVAHRLVLQAVYRF
jgi:hypothetical protein